MVHDPARRHDPRLDQKANLVVMEGTGHFFHRRLMDLRGLIKNHVQPNLP